MNIAKSLSTALFTTVVVVAAALTVKPAAHSSNIVADAGIETVTVTAHRMSAEEKAVFDQQEAGLASVTVSAHRMSNEEKAAFDRAQQM